MTTDTIITWPLKPVIPEQYVPVYEDNDSLNLEAFQDPPGPVSFVTQIEVRLPRPDLGNLRADTNRDWITLVLATAFVLFAFVRFNFPKRFVELLKASVFPRSVALLYKKSNPFNERISLILSIIYLITSSLFVFVVAERFEITIPQHFRHEYIYGAIVVVNAVYWMLKSATMRLLALIFKTHQAATNYLLNNMLFNMVSGLLLLIILPLVIYTGLGIMMNLALLLTGILLVYKVLRNVMIGLTIDHFPGFYLILYIFMLELAPLLIVVKLVMNHSA